MRRKSGLRDSPLARSTGTKSYCAPISASAKPIFNVLNDFVLALPWSCIMGTRSSTRPAASQGCSRFARHACGRCYKRGMDLLVVGHVTRDEVDGGVRLGGAGSYAALAAACLGYETALVTVAPPDDPLLEPLRRTPRLSLHCVPSDVMTTFGLDYAGEQRRLWLRRRARALTLDDIPAGWRRPRIAYVGAVAGECDTAFVKGLSASFVGAGLQGWLRRTDDDGRVQPARLKEAPVVQDPPALNVAV